MEGNSVKISDEQYAKIGAAIDEESREFRTLGKRAVAAVAPILLAEPTDKEKCALGMEARNTGYDTALECFVCNRLASLTAKPDPAVEAVKAEINRQAKCGDGLVVIGDFAAIVAAVDAARAK